MISYLLKSTYKTYHGKIGYFCLALLVTSSLVHSWLLGNIWPENIYDPIVGFDIKIFPHPYSWDMGLEIRNMEVHLIL